MTDQSSFRSVERASNTAPGSEKQYQSASYDAIAHLEAARVLLVRTLSSDPNWRALCQLDARESAGDIVEAVSGGHLRSSLVSALTPKPEYAAYQRISYAIATLQAPSQHNRAQQFPLAAYSAAVSTPAQQADPSTQRASGPPAQVANARAISVVTKTPSVPALVDREFAHVLATIRGFRSVLHQPQPSLTTRKPPDCPQDLRPKSAVRMSATPPPVPAFARPEPTSLAIERTPAPANAPDVKPQAPIHETALARLDRLEQDLDELILRPTGTVSPLSGNETKSRQASAPTITPSPVTPIVADPIESASIRESAPTETPSPGRLVQMIPKLAAGVPILEAKVEIVRTAIPRLRALPPPIAAADASAEPTMHLYGAEEASIAIVINR